MSWLNNDGLFGVRDNAQVLSFDRFFSSGFCTNSCASLCPVWGQYRGWGNALRLDPEARMWDRKPVIVCF